MQINISTQSKIYPIHFVANIDDIVAKILAQFHNHRFILITEKNIPEVYHFQIVQNLIAHNIQCDVINLQSSGEENKTLKNVDNVCETILSLGGITRSTIIIALGGGTIGDLCGFIASILMRGAHLIQIPTTLLSAVDSSIGGKTGVNSQNYKNMIGTFYQPEAVFINPEFFASLPYREYVSGYSEILKHALIYSKSFLDKLILGQERIRNRDANFISQIIHESCKIKASIVEQDEQEKLGIRAKLNVGHTIGHAFEKYFKILHGEAVALGIIFELMLAQEIGILKNPSIIHLLKHHIESLSLPVSIKYKNKNEFIQDLVKIMIMDKKNTYSKSQVQISFMLIEEIGVVQNILLSEDDLVKILNEII